MGLFRDSIDGFLGWTFRGDPKEFSKSVGCGCLVLLFVLALVAAGGFWIGAYW